MICYPQLFYEVGFLTFNLILLTYQIIKKNTMVTMILYRIPLAIAPTLIIQIALLSYEIIFLLPLCIFLFTLVGLNTYYLYKDITRVPQTISIGVLMVDMLALFIYLFSLIPCDYIYKGYTGHLFLPPPIMLILMILNIYATVILDSGFAVCFYLCGDCCCLQCCKQKENFFLMNVKDIEENYGTVDTVGPNGRTEGEDARM